MAKRDTSRQQADQGANVRLPRPRGAVPLGFRLTDDREALELDPDGLEAVRLILRRRSEGRSYAKIAAELEREGHATVRGGDWYPSTVRAVWTRRARYVGFVEELAVLRVLRRGRDY